MNRVELLTIEGCFQISSVGLAVLPDFSVPNGRWAERTETVLVVKPDGCNFEAKARFSLSHIKISDPEVSIDRRWRVTILFPEKTGQEVPVGSKIFVSHEIRDALLPNSVV